MALHLNRVEFHHPRMLNGFGSAKLKSAILKIYFRTTGPISNKLSTKPSWVKEGQELIQMNDQIIFQEEI